MKRVPRAALIMMLMSTVLFVVAVAWGAAFAFPEPDASGARADSLAFHALLSGWLMFAAVALFAASALVVAWRALLPQRK